MGVLGSLNDAFAELITSKKAVSLGLERCLFKLFSSGEQGSAPFITCSIYYI